MCGENTLNGNATGTESISSGEIRYVADGSNLLMIGGGEELAVVIDAEANRIDAQTELERVRLEAARFRAERDDVEFQRLSDAIDQMRQEVQISSNPFADLFPGFPGFGSSEHPGAD